MAFPGAIIYYMGQLFRRMLCAWLNYTALHKAAHFCSGSQFLGGGGRVYGWENINIGKNVKIMDGCFFNCSHGKLYIGDNTIISRNCLIYTWNHEYKGSRLPFDDQARENKVIIDNNVWVGMNVTILPGSLIKEGAIIGAGSVVAGKVERLSIVGAPIAQEMKKRDKEHYKSIASQGGA